MELRRLEGEATLAELAWGIEKECNGDGGLSFGVGMSLDTATIIVIKQPHATLTIISNSNVATGQLTMAVSNLSVNVTCKIGR